MGAKFDDLVEAAQDEVRAGDIARGLLIAIVNAKRNGEPNPEAWQDAFELVDEWAGEAGKVEPPTSMRCDACKAVLMLPLDGEHPEAVAVCGPEHVIRFPGHVLHVGPNGWRKIPYTAGTVITSHAPVFGDGKEPDGHVSG